MYGRNLSRGIWHCRKNRSSQSWSASISSSSVSGSAGCHADFEGGRAELGGGFFFISSGSGRIFSARAFSLSSILSFTLLSFTLLCVDVASTFLFVAPTLYFALFSAIRSASFRRLSSIFSSLAFNPGLYNFPFSITKARTSGFVAATMNLLNSCCVVLNFLASTPHFSSLHSISKSFDLPRVSSILKNQAYPLSPKRDSRYMIFSSRDASVSCEKYSALSLAITQRVQFPANKKRPAEYRCYTTLASVTFLKGPVTTSRRIFKYTRLMPIKKAR